MATTPNINTVAPAFGDEIRYHGSIAGAHGVGVVDYVDPVTGRLSIHVFQLDEPDPWHRLGRRLRRVRPESVTVLKAARRPKPARRWESNQLTLL